MLLEDFCAAIAAHTDMYYDGVITEREYNAIISRLWHIAARESIS